MELYIKSMVSSRCKMAVKNELERLGIYYSKVELGKIEFKDNNIHDKKINALAIALKKYGFEILFNKKNILVEEIKKRIIESILYSDYQMDVNFSDYLSKEMNYNYTYLANVFSQAEGNTIEHFIIERKIEKVKATLECGELNLTEIAYILNYTSVAHLSFQFKKITGLTPTHFKTLKLKKRTVLENI